MEKPFNTIECYKIIEINYDTENWLTYFEL